jgi:hypothetical protein
MKLHQTGLGTSQFHPALIHNDVVAAFGLGLSAVQTCSMVDRNVIFEAEQSSRGGWQIKCHCPGGKIDYVTGFLDEQSIQNWLATEHRDHWLTMRGF